MWREEGGISHLDALQISLLRRNMQRRVVITITLVYEVFVVQASDILQNLLKTQTNGKNMNFRTGWGKVNVTTPTFKATTLSSSAAQ